MPNGYIPEHHCLWLMLVHCNAIRPSADQTSHAGAAGGESNGYLRRPARYRVPDTWKWETEEMTNTFSTIKIINREGDSKMAAINVSLTSEVAEERIIQKYNAGIIYKITADRQNVDCIKSIEDLKAFWQQFQSVCDQIKNIDRLDSAAVFAATPVSAAFEIGRRHMNAVHPVLHLYDDNEGFFYALDIGGNPNE